MCTEMGIYEREIEKKRKKTHFRPRKKSKIQDKKERKHTFDQEKSKFKEKKHTFDQEKKED